MNTQYVEVSFLGEKSVTGFVSKATNTHIHVQTKNGTLSFPRSDKELTVKLISEETYKQSHLEVSKPNTEHGYQLTNGHSKMARCTNIFIQNSHLKRADVINLFMTQESIGMAHASTYYQNIKNKLNS